MASTKEIQSSLSRLMKLKSSVEKINKAGGNITASVIGDVIRVVGSKKDLETLTCEITKI